MYLCNKNELEALFMLSLFRQSTSISFGHICSPSSGGIYIYTTTGTCLCFLVDCLFANCCTYADKSLARPGRKKATATEDYDVHISYL